MGEGGECKYGWEWKTREMFTGLLQEGGGWRCRRCHPGKLTMMVLGLVDKRVQILDS